MKKRITSLLSALSILSILLIGAVSSQVRAEQSFDVEKAISSGDHKGLAEYYRSKAEEQRKIAEMHEKMKTSYKNTHVHYKGSENALATHCGNLQIKAREMADQYDKLAQEEEKLAGKK